MPNIAAHQTLRWPLPGNQRLAWYSPSRRGFVIGNHADKSLVPLPIGDGANTITRLVTHADAYASKSHAYDDQLGPADYDELRAQDLSGFNLLTREQYDRAFTGQKFGSTTPIDQALVSGLTNELPVAHPGAGGAILSIANKRIVLRTLTDTGLNEIAETKAKAAITAVAASPADPLLFYGTNAGDVFAVPIKPDNLGLQKKLAAFGRVTTSLRVTADGKHLLAGGMGYLASLPATDRPSEPLAKLEISCRAIHILTPRWLLLNQGLHGVALVEQSDTTFRVATSHKPDEPIDRLICSTDGRWTLAIAQPPGGMLLLSLDLTT